MVEFAILIIGASGFIAQMTVLRELLVGFYGNELTIGLILGCWMLLEALGVFLTGKIIRGKSNILGLLAGLQMLFVFGFFVSIFLARTFKGADFGQNLDFISLLLVSLEVMLPVAISHAGLFGVCCAIAADRSKGLARVYAWETGGSILAGFLITYIIVPYVQPFLLAQVLGIINFIVILPFFLKTQAKFRSRAPVILLIAGLAVLALVRPDQLQQRSLKLFFRGTEILDYRNSLYGNIAVTSREGQKTLFYNGIPSIVIPYPDTALSEELGHLPIFFRGRTRKVLLIEEGRGSLIPQILKHPVSRLDYLEIDPQIELSLKKTAPDFLEREIQDRRLRIIHQDSRSFLKNNPEKYDLIVVGASGPQDLVSNRLYTEEFFSLAGKHLESGGILALRLAGSLTYLSDPLRDLNFSVLNALHPVFGSVRLIPGDQNLVLASDSAEIISLDRSKVEKRLKDSGMDLKVLTPAYLDYRLDESRAKWFKSFQDQATRKINRDFAPIALFQAMLIWNRQFFPQAAAFFERSARFDLSGALTIVGILFLLFYLPSRRNPLRPTLTYCLATSGFFGMMISLELVLGFQVGYGYIYRSLAMLLAVFMAGSAFAAAVYPVVAGKRSLWSGHLLLLETAMAIFPLPLYFFLLHAGNTSSGLAIFGLMFFVAGAFPGLEFAVCSRGFSGDDPAGAAGKLYSADLLGASIAGLLGGVWLLPVLGLGGCSALLSCLKLTSLILAYNLNKYKKKG